MNTLRTIVARIRASLVEWDESDTITGLDRLQRYGYADYTNYREGQ